MWYYFRTGYGTYLTFFLGVLNTVTVVYYLLIKNVPALEILFPSFVTFTLIAVGIGLPLSVITGWAHIKGTPAMASEQDIMAEASPYYYKLPPGYNREVFAPLYLELLKMVKMIVERDKLLTDEEEATIRELEIKLKILMDGGYVGKSRLRTLT